MNDVRSLVASGQGTGVAQPSRARTRVVRLRFMTADRAAIDRLRDRYAAEYGRTLTRMGAARAIIRRGLVDADARPLRDVLGDVDPDGVSRLPTHAAQPKGGA